MTLEYLLSYLGLLIHIFCFGLIIYIGCELEKEEELAFRFPYKKSLEENS